MDSQIIALLSARDESALAMIREQYGTLCETLAMRLLGSREDAEECVSDMLLAVWNSDAVLRAETLRAFLVSLVRRAAMDKLKARTRKKRGGKQFALALDELAEILPANDRVEQEIDRKELSAAIAAWLRTLPQDSRFIFIARYYLSESVQEIAQKYGMSAGAVKMSLLRTRNKLRKHLEQEGFL